MSSTVGRFVARGEFTPQAKANLIAGKNMQVTLSRRGSISFEDKDIGLKLDSHRTPQKDEPIAQHSVSVKEKDTAQEDIKVFYEAVENDMYSRTGQEDQEFRFRTQKDALNFAVSQNPHIEKLLEEAMKPEPQTEQITPTLYANFPYKK